MDDLTKFSTVIQPWGNSLGLRITRPLAQTARIRKGSRVTIEVVKEGLLVKAEAPAKRPLKLPFSEAELVHGLTPRKAHADELPVPLVSELEP
ncbi:MAG: AbrB/MazE/SpoVT family DNA-binding domain-containing protein [Gammaproteobacteria bacterium]